MLSYVIQCFLENIIYTEADIIVLNNLPTFHSSEPSTKLEGNSPTWMLEVLPMHMERRESMDTGLRLKYHRLKKKISLEEAASGILSPRELKKIESGMKEPALKDLEALCKKLEIPLAPKDNPVGKVLVKNFKTSLLHPQNKGKIMEQYSDIQDHPLLSVDEDIELEYRIQQIRYFIVTGDLDSAEEKLKDLERFKEFMDQEQFYLFHKYNGNYHYILNDFEKALKTYLMAEKIAPSSVPASEKGDLFYSIGISASQCWDIEMAYKYTDLALKTYQQEFIPKRIVECHMNMGVTHNRLGNYKTSLEHYINALNIGKKLEIDILRFTTEYNVGYSSFLNQKFEVAISHLEVALEYVPKEYTADILLTYSYLVLSEIELNNLSKAQYWAKKGIELIALKDLNLNSPANGVFKIAYVQFMCLHHFIIEEYEEFEKMVINHLLPSLKKMKFFYEVGYFNNLLGNVYYELGLYEKSANVLKESQKAYRSLMRVK